MGTLFKIPSLEIKGISSHDIKTNSNINVIPKGNAEKYFKRFSKLPPREVKHPEVSDIPITNILKVKMKTKALSYKRRHYLHRAISRLFVSLFL